MDDVFSEPVTVKFSPRLLDVIDRAAAASFSSRSNFIRGATVERIRREQIALFETASSTATHDGQ
jgi:metal-responsive CopG/Arc/MetJ family transcriptional regulator